MQHLVHRILNVCQQLIRRLLLLKGQLQVVVEDTVGGGLGGELNLGVKVFENFRRFAPGAKIFIGFF